ncbi:MAG: HAD-IIIA family hydrolase [Methylococcus sp.]|nr:MAG: HAD-IIIA family hydrolase [Methylococcus sp.]
MKHRYDLLIFDWDGTLCDSIGWIVECLEVSAAAVSLPIPPRAKARSVIGLSLGEAMDTLFPGQPKAAIDDLIGYYRSHYHSRSLEHLALFPGVPDFLSQLRDEGFKLAVATGKARSGLDPMLVSTGLTEMFHATRCADETASKPHPMMVEELLSALQVTPKRTLLIGDSVHDLQLARNAGVDAVAVAAGANTRDELLELQPLVCLEQTIDLLTHFKQRTP